MDIWGMDIGEEKRYTVMHKIQLVIKSDPEDVSLVSAAIRGVNSHLDIQREDSESIVLGMVEAINNCIEHAYQNKYSEEIKIDYRIESDVINIEISDHGITMEKEPNFDLPDDLETESGRGWFIIGACFDKVEYQSENGLNVLALQKIYNSQT